MPKFAIAYFSFFTNELKMKIVEAENEREALILALKYAEIKLDSDDLKKDEEELKQFAFDCDSMIGAIQLP